jgi:allantoinase
MTPEGVRPAVVEVRDGVIAALHAHDAAPAGLPVTDVGTLVVGPGVVDTHVHVNEPGRTEWEGFATATRAAAAGGVTTLVDMPLNSVPATLDPASLAAKRAAAEGKCAVDVGFLGGAGPANLDQLAALHAAGVLGFKCFLVPSGVDEFPHADANVLERVLETLAPLDTVLMAHCELPGPIAAAPTPAATRRYREYEATRPVAAESEAIALLLPLAERKGARVHVVHLSSAASLPLVAAARGRGVRVTVETCPHYLHFAAEDVPDGATEYKCAPPIRGRDEREALWHALAGGAIPHVASDHSPCPPARKQRDTGDFMAAWGGIASLQLTLPVVWSGMRARGLALERLGEWLAAAPARLLGLERRKGAIAPGRDADFVVWDPDTMFRVHAAELLHRHPLTPYDGARLHGVVHATWLRGTLVFARDRGVVAGHGRLLHRETIALS